MQKSLETFFRKCRIKGLAAGTIKGYGYNLSTFHKFYPGKLDELTQDDVDRYVESLLESYSNLTTVNNKLKDLRMFLRWYGKDFDISLIKKNEVEIVPFELWQLKAIYEACLEVEGTKNYKGKGYCHFRDYIIMRILEETGMRIGEVLRLQPRDIDIKHLTIYIKESKSKKPRVTFFTQSLRVELETFLKTRQAFLSENKLAATSLFVNNMGQSFCQRTIGQNITRYGELAGITGVRVSPHTFRHTFAKNFLINGGDIFTLKDLLGHSTLDMVYRYARLWDNQRANQYQRVMENYTRSKKRAAK